MRQSGPGRINEGFSVEKGLDWAWVITSGIGREFTWGAQAVANHVKLVYEDHHADQSGKTAVARLAETTAIFR